MTDDLTEAETAAVEEDRLVFESLVALCMEPRAWIERQPEDAAEGAISEAAENSAENFARAVAGMPPKRVFTLLFMACLEIADHRFEEKMVRRGLAAFLASDPAFSAAGHIHVPVVPEGEDG